MGLIAAGALPCLPSTVHAKPGTSFYNSHGILLLSAAETVVGGGSSSSSMAELEGRLGVGQDSGVRVMDFSHGLSGGQGADSEGWVGIATAIACRSSWGGEP